MTEVVALAIGAFFGALVSGCAGFAFSAACGAVLLHVLEPQQAIPLMMACSITSQILAMVSLRQTVAFRTSVWLLLGGAAGVAGAVVLLGLLDARVLRMVFGAFLALYAGYLLVRRPIETRLGSGAAGDVLVGTAGGAIGVLTAMPGAIPTLWCELRGCSKEESRGFVQPFIIVMQIVALILLASRSAGLPREMPFHLLVALPSLCLGSWLGTLAFRRARDTVARKIVLLVLIASGVMLLR